MAGPDVFSGGSDVVKGTGSDGVMAPKKAEKAAENPALLLFKEILEENLIILSKGSVSPLNFAILSQILGVTTTLDSPSDLGLHLSAEQYLAKIAEFNSEYGSVFEIRIDSGQPCIVFHEPIGVLADNLDKAFGSKVAVNRSYDNSDGETMAFLTADSKAVFISKLRDEEGAEIGSKVPAANIKKPALEILKAYLGHYSIMAEPKQSSPE